MAVFYLWPPRGFFWLPLFTGTYKLGDREPEGIVNLLSRQGARLREQATGQK